MENKKYFTYNEIVDICNKENMTMYEYGEKELIGKHFIVCEDEEGNFLSLILENIDNVNDRLIYKVIYKTVCFYC